MHPGEVIEVLGVFIQLDGHSGAPLWSAIKQMSSAVKCVSLYCRWSGTLVIFDSSLSLALTAGTTSETPKGNGRDNLKSQPLQPTTEGKEAFIFSNEILSLAQHETV